VLFVGLSDLRGSEPSPSSLIRHRTLVALCPESLSTSPSSTQARFSVSAFSKIVPTAGILVVTTQAFAKSRLLTEHNLTQATGREVAASVEVVSGSCQRSIPRGVISTL